MSASGRTGSGGRLVLGGIRFYQAARAGRRSPCRFEPSCSTYAAEAIELHGAVRGSLMGLRRIGRCRPFGGQGWDPVPDVAHHVDRTA